MRSRFNAVYCLSLNRGCRQVVRPELPKLVFAGSSPVTRSRELRGNGNPPLPFSFSAHTGVS